MVDQKKLFRVFQLISRLRSPFGTTKADLARDFDVTERTIERYFVLLDELGFDIQKRDNYFKIENVGRYQVTPEEYIVFSIEEAAIVKEAIESSRVRTPLQKSLLSKLYALTDIDEISDTLYSQSISKSINNIRRAIKEKKQVVLKSYHSVNSNKTSDRLIEPIKFFHYCTYLLAFEVSSKKVKQYKTDRIGIAEIKNTAWHFEAKHDIKHIDAFGMSGKIPVNVVLKLSPRAHCLLEEEFPDTKRQIKKDKGDIYYTGKVYSYKGLGRFIMGLLDEIEVIEPVELQVYIEEKVEEWKKRRRVAPP